MDFPTSFKSRFGGLSSFLAVLVLLISFTLFNLRVEVKFSMELRSNSASSASSSIGTKENDHEKKFNDETNAEILKRYHTSDLLAIPVSEYQHLSSPVKDLLKVYVYDPDTLPGNLSQYTKLPPERVIPTNTNTEVVLLNLFQSFPGRTLNASEADIFVVPYLHANHCFDTPPGLRLGCSNVQKSVLQDVMDSLPYLNEQTRKRHLFIATYGPYQTDRRLNEWPLILTFGNRKGPGHIVVPQFNNEIDFQPSTVLSLSTDTWTRDRTYSMVYAGGLINPRMRRNQPRRFRQYFYDHFNTSRAWNDTMIREKPYIVSKGVVPSMYDLYQDSVFCPILPGDCTWQRRIFDAIAKQCLPVVQTWAVAGNDDDPLSRTWWIPDLGPSARDSYPFASGAFNESLMDPDFQPVRYEDFVVHSKGIANNESDMSAMEKELESLLDQPDKIREKQLAMQRHAVSLLFGVGAEAHLHEDAFAKTIRALRSYVDNFAQ